MTYYSSGMAMRNDFGQVTCPHCCETVRKTNKNQITCGKMPCQDKQNAEAYRRRTARLKALRLEAAKAVESVGASQ